MKIIFLGAAQTVTGSKYLIETNDNKKYLVDCGLFQGLKQLRLLNWQPLSVKANEIDSIFLTHAHLDHSGFIPRLVKAGFNGKIYCTESTYKLCEILLYDSAKIQEEDAEYFNRKKISIHKPALPLYSYDDVEKALKHFELVKLNDEFKVNNVLINYSSAGHVLGASSIRIQGDGTSVLFSGDLGKQNDLVMYPPDKPQDADCIVMESTYGNRLHPKTDVLDELKNVISKVIQNQSVLLIPSFAFGRVQTLIYSIALVFKKYPHFKIPVYVNSPMATDITELYLKYCNGHKLTKDECPGYLSYPTFVNDTEESKKLNFVKGPVIIIAASGMLTGGRILHHIISCGGNPKNIILIVGYQPPGTRGYDLINGKKDIKIFKQYVNVKAEVVNLDIFSAHADQKDLLYWLSTASVKPKKVFLTHGEKDSAEKLKEIIYKQFKYDVKIPAMGESYNLHAVVKLS